LNGTIDTLKGAEPTSHPLQVGGSPLGADQP
jgi:hypothetical protein